MSTRAILTFFVLTVFAQAEDEAWHAPTQIVFNNGTTLHNVSVVRWEKDRVIVKHRGGVGPAMFRYIKTPDAAALAKWRDVTESGLIKLENKPKGHEITGQVFITTAGAGAYKFAGAVIKVMPAHLKTQMVAHWRSRLPLNYRALYGFERDKAAALAWADTFASYKNQMITEVTTDADGKYRLTLEKPQPVLLMCLTTRSVGYSTEFNFWLVDVAPGETEITMNSHNSSI